MRLGRDLAELTAGIDALYRAGLGDSSVLNADGLIPVAVAEVAPRPLRDWTEAREALSALSDRIPGEAEDAARAAWLTEMTESVASLARMFSGERLGFAERLRDQLRVEPRPIPETILDGYRADLGEALEAMGYRSGDLAADVARWEDDTTVPPGEVIARLTELQRQAQERSRRLVIDTGADWTTPEGVHDKPYNAYCDYPGRHVWLNLDFRYTQADLKHLATHEAFPGHLVHLARREALVAAGRMPLDGAQVVTNSASSPLFEGIAENGIALLDWIEGPQDHAGLAMMRLRSALRCNASWMVFEDGLTIREAARATCGPSFMEEEPMTRRLAFLSHELRAPFLFAYWCGDDAVRRFLEATRDWDRPRIMGSLYDTMHTPTTLAAAALG